MNPERIDEKQSKEFGKQVKGSKYFRDFCSGCGQPIRVPSEKLYNDNYCQDCNGHNPPVGSVTKLGHLSDYYGANSPEIGNDYECDREGDGENLNE